jgi:nucleoside-diphosphate-sugar epimerase/lipopolysaccharide/colanic/teichoic acid biosynthesis glycosyltransferase
MGRGARLGPAAASATGENHQLVNSGMDDIERELSKKHILITGVAGFIGSRLTKALLDYDAEIIAPVDKLTDLSRIKPWLTDPRLHLTHCDLTDFHDLPFRGQKWGEIDLIVHLGIVVPSDNGFYQQSVQNITMNLLPTINLINAAGSRLHGICFASSVSVYGAPVHLPIKESDLPTPINSYGATKLATENYLRCYGRENKVPVTILRYATVYGPGEFNHRAVPNFLQAIARGKSPQIYGDGSEIRDYVYVDDVVQATLLAMAKKPDMVLNIGSGHGFPTTQLAKEVSRLYGGAAEPEFVPTDKNKTDYVVDISAAGEALSYSPQTSLEKGLIQEIEWFKSQLVNKEPKRRNGLRHWCSYSLWKGVADRFMALLAILVSSPVMALIAITIRLDSRGNPIFAQERIGKDGRKFIAFKFRTMYSNHDDTKYREYIRRYVTENAPYRVDDNGQHIYKVDDTPVTRLGSILRKTNLDELPQFVNILKGEMSFVGPRPDVPFSVELYSDWHRKRLRVKPGLTGLWQVCQRKALSFNAMARLDIDYIKRQSPLLDAKILWSTVGTVIRRDGS